jgi:hypothetical protein
MAVDLQEMFKTAEVFRDAAGALAQSMGKGMLHLMFPMVVNGAFSMELHLKCLLAVENNVTKGHDLKALFSALSKDSQDWIRGTYEKKYRPQEEARYRSVPGVPHPSTDFDEVLAASSRAFEKFRYAFEGSVKDGEGWLAGSILECVRERTLALRPDLKS